MSMSLTRKVLAAGVIVLLASSSSLPGQNTSTSVSQHTERAEQALKAHDLAGAEREYRAILALDSQNSAAWTGLGVLLYGSAKFEPAREALQKALTLDPASQRAELFLALSEADLRQCALAKPILARRFASEPAGKLQRLVGLALLGCELDDADSMPALQTAARLKQLYPGDEDVLYESAGLYTRLWNQSAGELMARHPESYRVHELAGEVYEAQNNYDQAIREYSLAIEKNPKLTQMHFRIGQLYLRQAAADADDKAMSEFQKEKLIDPQSALSDLAMADIQLHRQNLDEAKALYQEAATLDPALLDARVGLAKVQVEQHDIASAVGELKSIIAEHPENASAHYVLMLAYRQQKKMPEASDEMTIFNRLQTEKNETFQNKMNALLNATPPAEETERK